MDAWLRRQGQSEAAMRLFWLPLLVSALSQTPEHIDVDVARKVLVDGFLAARQAYRLFLPQAPLGEIYDRRAAQHLAAQGITLRLGTAVRQVEGDLAGAVGVVLRDGTRLPFDAVVLAVPWHRAAAMLDPRMLEALPIVRAAAALPRAPITAIHLWFDRRIMRLPHALLVGRTSQWVFSRHDDHYYQVVISAAQEILKENRRHAVGQVCEELRLVCPRAREARLRHWRMITQPAAVFSAEPGAERLRPPQQTAIRHLFLAGDWTATGWPATMEGAVRSGCLAIEALLRSQGRPAQLLVPDLPRGRLAQWLWGP
jgi:squalene-associated FAD-dependent desaturase